MNPKTTPLRLSVIIPTLNSPLLARTLEGLHQQNYDPTLIEVIVVGLDKDESVKHYPSFLFIDTLQARAPAISRNIGLRMATGDVVCFIDDDCVPKPDWLTNLAQAYADAAVMVVGGGIDFPNHGYWAQSDALAAAFEQLSFRPKGVRRQLPSMNFSARRHVLMAYSGFDETFAFASGEDAELCMRLRRNGHLLHFEPGASIEHLGWRGTVRTMVRHIYRYGIYSPWINPRLSDIVQPPVFMRHWLLMLLATVPLAGWITVRMYLRESQLWRHLHLIPGLFLAQLAWGAGVVRGLYARSQA